MSQAMIRQLQFEIADIARNIEAMKDGPRTPKAMIKFSRLLAGSRRRKAKIAALEGGT